jgi:hypothetical protein
MAHNGALYVELLMLNAEQKHNLMANLACRTTKWGTSGRFWWESHLKRDHQEDIDGGGSIVL